MTTMMNNTVTVKEYGGGKVCDGGSGYSWIVLISGTIMAYCDTQEEAARFASNYRQMCDRIASTERARSCGAVSPHTGNACQKGRDHDGRHATDGAPGEVWS